MRYGIVGTGSYLPSRVVTNEELTCQLTVSAAWIEERTGIYERRFADQGEATSDLATEAARRAVDDAGIDTSELDVIVVGTSTPDYPQPATGCLVQRRLSAENAAAFDVNSVCSSFVYALDVARGLLHADDRRRYALVIGADVYSRIIDVNDPRSCVLFGDGAGAVVLGPVDDTRGLLTSHLVSDGRLYELVRVPGGGSRRPLTHAGLSSGEDRFTMRGRDVRDYVRRVVPEVLARLLKEASLRIEDVDLVVPHQANAVLLRSSFAEAGVDLARVHLTCPWLGNTAAASVPISLDDAVRTRGLEDGAVLVLISIGGGMSAGGALLRWCRHDEVQAA